MERYPELHDSLDVVEHLCDVSEAGKAVVGAVVAAHDPSAPPALPRGSLNMCQGACFKPACSSCLAARLHIASHRTQNTLRKG